MEKNKTATEKFINNISLLGRDLMVYLKDAQSRGFKGLDVSLLELAISVISSGDKETVMMYIVYSVDYWSIIKEKKREFLEQNMMDIFGAKMNEIAGSSTLEIFNGQDKNGNPWIGSEKEKKLWNYFRCLTRIALSYIKENPSDKKTVEKYYRDYKKKNFNYNWEELQLEYFDNWTQ